VPFQQGRTGRAKLENDFEAARDGIEHSKVVAERPSVTDRLVWKLSEAVARSGNAIL
jgi:hypothetical protein